MEKMIDERRYTEKQAAQVLGVSAMTVRRHRERGALGYYQIGSRIFISERQISDFLEQSEQKPIYN